MAEGPIFHNRRAAVGWVFMAIWLGMLTIITWLFLRDDGFHQFSRPVEAGIILMFWVFGIGGAAYLFSHPLIRLVRRGDSLIVTERWLLRRRDCTVAIADLAPPRIDETVDSEGDPYFCCILDLPGGRAVAFSEHNRRAPAEEAILAFAAATA